MIESLNEDKRRFPRLRIPIPAAYVLGDDAPVSCMIDNLSAEGAQISTREEIPSGSLLSQLRFQVRVEGRDEPIEVAPSARTVRCVPLEGRSAKFSIGMQFVDSDPDEIALVQQFVYYQLMKQAGEAPDPSTLPVWKRRITVEHPIAIRFGRFEEFVEEVTYNLSVTGMYIKSRRPLPVGEVFEFEFQLGEDFSLLKGRAQVVWARKRAEGPNRPAGMGVHFVDLDETSLALIERLVSERAAAEDTAASSGSTPSEAEVWTEFSVAAPDAGSAAQTADRPSPVDTQVTAKSATSTESAADEPPRAANAGAPAPSPPDAPAGYETATAAAPTATTEDPRPSRRANAVPMGDADVRFVDSLLDMELTPEPTPAPPAPSNAVAALEPHPARPSNRTEPLVVDAAPWLLEDAPPANADGKEKGTPSAPPTPKVIRAQTPPPPLVAPPKPRTLVDELQSIQRRAPAEPAGRPFDFGSAGATAPPTEPSPTADEPTAEPAAAQTPAPATGEPPVVAEGSNESTGSAATDVSHPPTLVTDLESLDLEIDDAPGSSTGETAIFETTAETGADTSPQVEHADAGTSAHEEAVAEVPVAELPVAKAPVDEEPNTNEPTAETSAARQGSSQEPFDPKPAVAEASVPDPVVEPQIVESSTTESAAQTIEAAEPTEIDPKTTASWESAARETFAGEETEAPRATAATAESKHETSTSDSEAAGVLGEDASPHTEVARETEDTETNATISPPEAETMPTAVTDELPDEAASPAIGGKEDSEVVIDGPRALEEDSKQAEPVEADHDTPSPRAADPEPFVDTPTEPQRVDDLDASNGAAALQAALLTARSRELDLRVRLEEALEAAATSDGSSERELRAAHARHERELKVAEERAEALLGEIETARAELSDARTRLDEANARIDELEEERTAATEAESEATEQKIAELESDRSKLERSIRDGKARIETLLEERDRYAYDAKSAATELEEATQQIAALEAETQRLQNESEVDQERIHRAGVRSDELRASNREYRQKIGNLKAALRRAETERQSIDRDRTKKSSLLRETLTRLDELVRERTEVDQRLDAREHDLHRVVDKLDLSRQRADQLERRVSDLEESLVRERTAQRERTDWQRQFDDRTTALEAQLEAARSDLESAIDREVTLTAELDDLRRTLEAERAEHHSSLERAFEAIDHPDERVTALEAELRSTREVGDELQSQLESAHARLREVERSTAQETDRLETEELTELHRLVDSVAGRIAELETELFAAERERESEATALRREIETLHAFAEVVTEPTENDALRETEEELFFTAEALGGAQAEIDRLQNELDAAREAEASAAEAHRAERARAEEESLQTSDRESRLEMEVARQTARAEELERELELAEGRLDEARTELEVERERAANAPKDSALHGLLEEVELAREQIAMLEGDLERRRLEARVSASELEAARESLAQARRDKAMLENQRSDREESRTEITRLAELNERLEEKLTQADRRASDADDRTVKLERELEEIRLSGFSGDAPRTPRQPATGVLSRVAPVAGGVLLGGALLFGAASTPIGESWFERPAPTPSVERPVEALPAPAEKSAPVTPSSTEPPAPLPTAPRNGEASMSLAAEHPDLEDTIRAWAAAWSEQDAETYLSFYGAGFLTPRGQSRAEWAEERARRIRAPRSVRIEIGAMTPEPIAEDRIVVRFPQAYITPNYRDDVVKTLDFGRENGRWVIIEETSRDAR